MASAAPRKGLYASWSMEYSVCWGAGRSIEFSLALIYQYQCHACMPLPCLFFLCSPPAHPAGVASTCTVHCRLPPAMQACWRALCSVPLRYKIGTSHALRASIASPRPAPHVLYPTSPALLRPRASSKTACFFSVYPLKASTRTFRTTYEYRYLRVLPSTPTKACMDRLTHMPPVTACIP